MKKALKIAVVEKDVENAYREGVHKARPKATITSPHKTDGYAQWDHVRLLLEAKLDQDFKNRVPICTTLGQCLLYLKRFEASGEPLPNVLLVGDRDECFVLATSAVQNFLNLPLDWTVAPSTGSPELTRALVDGLNILPYVYDVDGNFDFKKVVEKCETLAAGSQHSVRATPTNIGAIFLYWVDRVFKGTTLTPVEQVDVFLRCLFQPTDVYLHPTKRGVLVVPGYGDKVLISTEQYQSFFDHFQQGYKPSEIEFFYGMKDRLVEDDARRRQGAFFTPSIWVNEAHAELDRVLGEGWRETCIVWDPAAGTANLTRDYQDWGKAGGALISSTAERPDVNVMQEQGWGGRSFQYDFLNPDVESPFFDPRDGANVLPDDVVKLLVAAAKAGKRLVFLMNPPYAEDGVAGARGTTKSGVAITAMNKDMGKLGRANRQLYAQFMYRCSKLVQEYGFSTSTVGIFCKPTFMSSGSYKPFRDWWYDSHEYQGGFLFQASHFADVSGAWGISFTVWDSGGSTNDKDDLPIRLTDERDFSVTTDRIKSIYNSDGREASLWVEGRQTGHVGDTPKFSSGLKVAEKWGGGSLLGSLGVLVSIGNNLMKSGTDVYLLSGKPTHKGARHFDLLPSNWRRAVAVYGARKLVKGDWVNDKDEYLVPAEGSPGYESWVNDCHVYALLHPSNNCTAMRDVSYANKTWRIKNHWFWLTKAQALKALDTVATPALYKDCKAEADDPYFATQLPSLQLSPEAQRVMDLLQALWLKSLPVREAYAAGKPELHLLAHDAGVYQLKHLWSELFPDEWKALKLAHKALAEKLQPGVYDFGFLRR